MKVLRILIIVVFIAVSCKQKSVQLPALGVVGIQDTIYNNSKIWIFYNLHGNDTIAQLNKNNSVANTHWIFNIDKRLSLKQVIPLIQQLQAKKEKPSMHDDGENTHSYFSYVDTVSNKFSLILFDSIKYIASDAINFDSISLAKNFKHIGINYTENGIFINDRVTEITKIEDYLLKQHDSTLLKVYLSFDKNLSYRNYIHLKAILENIKNDSIIIDKNESVNFK